MAEYHYELLEQVPGAAPLLAHFQAILADFPPELETPLPVGRNMALRWCASSPSAGLATLRHNNQLVSLSLLVCGQDPSADITTLQAFQQHLVRELHDTGVEPAFTLIELEQRPLVATVNFLPPTTPEEQYVAALTDRCFAAAYFRRQGLV